MDNALVAVPLSKVGVGGVQNFVVLGAPATLSANPWTTEAVSVSGGFDGEDPITFTDEGFDDRDATGAGSLKLVTTALVDLGAIGTVPAIMNVQIHFAPVPEPGTLLTVAGGLVMLAIRRPRV